jgi:hypothetical protein
MARRRYTKRRAQRTKRTRRTRTRKQRGGGLRFESVGKDNEKNTVVTVFPNPKDEVENVPLVTSLPKAQVLLNDE